jgi:hypothetical protein
MANRREDVTNQGEDQNYFNQMLKVAIDTALRNTYVCCPGIIDSFDPVIQTATIQPAIRQQSIDAEGNKVTKKLPLLINVPVIFPESGGFSLTFPVKKGDECLVLFADRNFESWQDQGGIQEQPSVRIHDISDGLAIIGFNSKPNVIQNFNNDKMQMRNSDASAIVEMDESGNISSINDNGFIKLQSDGTVDINGFTIDPSGNAITPGTINADDVTADNQDVTLSSHKHPASNQPPTPGT